MIKNGYLIITICIFVELYTNSKLQKIHKFKISLDNFTFNSLVVQII